MQVEPVLGFNAGLTTLGCSASTYDEPHLNFVFDFNGLRLYNKGYFDGWLSKDNIDEWLRSVGPGKYNINCVLDPRSLNEMVSYDVANPFPWPYRAFRSNCSNVMVWP